MLPQTRPLIVNHLQAGLLGSGAFYGTMPHTLTTLDTPRFDAQGTPMAEWKIGYITVYYGTKYWRWFPQVLSGVSPVYPGWAGRPAAYYKVWGCYIWRFLITHVVKVPT